MVLVVVLEEKELGYSYIEARLWFGFNCPVQTRIKGLLGSQKTHDQIRITLRKCWHAMQRSKFTFLNAFQTCVDNYIAIAIEAGHSPNP